MELNRPLLLYDGDCGFCASCARLLARIGPRATIVPWQCVDLSGLPVTERQAGEAVQWVAPDAEVRSGHEAIAAVLVTAGQPWRALGRMLLLPGVSWSAARVYRFVAANRATFSRIFRKSSGST